MSGTFKLLVVGIVGSAVVFFLLPRETQFDIRDAVKRIASPHLDLPPDGPGSSENQTSWIAQYTSRGYKLRCYGGLAPEEKIDPSTDYMCWGIIKSAYDNVPARTVSFYFTKQELRHVKVEFPGSAFDALQDYLGRRLERFERLDRDPKRKFGSDIYGKPLMVWNTTDGLVMTSGQATRNQTLMLLWSSKKNFGV